MSASPISSSPVVESGRRVEIRGLVAGYGEARVLSGVDATFHGGRLTAVIGPNGSGKSTLMNALAGAHPVDAGTMRSMGPDGAHPLAGRVAWVPQRSSIDRDLPVTVRGLVRQGRWSKLAWWQREGAADRAAVDRALGACELLDLADRPLDALSGGQLQRVFVARALAADAHIWLLDEPFAAIDRASEAKILEVLRGLRGRGDVVVVIDHDLGQVRERYDDALVLGGGHVVASGPVEEAFTAASLDQAWRGGLGPLASRWTGADSDG